MEVLIYVYLALGAGVATHQLYEHWKEIRYVNQNYIPVFLMIMLLWPFALIK